MKYITSFWYYFRKKEVQFQYYPSWSWLPWANHTNEDFEGRTFTSIYVGWFCFQAKWFHV